MFSSAFYVHSPLWAQQAMIAMRERIQRALRENRRFDCVLAEIQSTQWLDEQALKSLQDKRLIAIVRYAVRHVRYYRELFRREGWDPRDFRGAEDLRLLPVLTKQDIVANPSAFVAVSIGRPRFRVSTSGTTGTPLTLYQDQEAIIREHAFVWRHLLWAGLQRGQRRAWFRGDMIAPVQKTEPPFWRMNRPANMLMLSSYHLSEANAEGYIRALESFDPVVIQAYPSSISFLARAMEMLSRCYEGRSLKGIVTSSETLTTEQRTIVESKFRCRVFDQYGSTEKIVLIGTCEAGTRHMELDYGFGEYLDCDDGSCELVGTGFYNSVTPLIRYRIGDRIVLKNRSERCTCGRNMPIVERVEGRLDDYVITPDGRQVGRLDHIFKDVWNVVEAQIRQDRVGEVTILVVPAEKFGKPDQDRIIHNTRERLGADTRISVRSVESIQRGPNGKFRAVVCTLNSVSTNASDSY
ncbi:MAG: hypothetical protein WD823_00950 [Sulfuricaulis sp.]|uniref:phenylacetate--CoA ligase family protein n=1 Tax=Sulfuricaulis sp. TaxID=2003553 RepID=UPI0034A4EEDA